MLNEKDFLTTSEFAKLLQKKKKNENVSRQYVHLLIRSGKLSAIKFKNRYLIPKTECKKFNIKMEELCQK